MTISMRTLSNDHFNEDTVKRLFHGDIDKVLGSELY